jgi:ribosomal-protein-alanine N-acetyltransferase
MTTLPHGPPGIPRVREERIALSEMVEIVGARPEHLPVFLSFLSSVDTPEERRFFSPHPFDGETAARICNYTGPDAYYLMLRNGEVVGYGLLRGWEEGFAIPSLGICIAPAYRSHKLGKLLMGFLHAEARRRGCQKVRLKVRKENARARAMYCAMGYEFAFEENGFLIGILTLREAGGGKG